MIEASQRMIRVNSQGGELGGINPVIRKTLQELKIKTLLQNAPIEMQMISWKGFCNQKKGRSMHEAMHIRDIERLVTEIEMLRVVLYLVCRNNNDMRAKTTNNKQH